MKLKKKRKREWCHKEPVPYNGTGIFAKGWRYGCQTGTTFKSRTGKKVDIPKRITCPDCKKRFLPRVRECNDYDCWHIYLPAHKRMV